MKSSYHSILILLLVSLVYLILGINIDNPTFSDLRIVGGLALLQFFFSIFSSLKAGQKLVSPYIVFLIVLYVFQIGQSLFYPFGIVSSKDLVGFFGITIKDIFEAQLITLAFLAFFQIGSLLCKNRRQKLKPLSVAIRQNRRLLQLGWFLVIISVYPYYQELIHRAVLSMLRGYGALYEGTAKIGFANFGAILGDYFVPALVCLYIGYRNKVVYRRIITCVLLFNCAVILVTGGRSEAVIILSLLLILRNTLVKKFTRKNLMIIGCGCIFLLMLLSSISRIRSSGSRDFSDTFSFDNGEGSNGAVEAVCEMGNSMFCQIWTKEILDDTGSYRYGSSYAFAFTSIIPNLGFWDIHPAKTYAELGDWLTKEKKLHFGTGFSMVAEAYANFGVFGFFMMMLLGYLFTKIFGQLQSSINSGNIALTAFILIFFWFSLKIPRNSFIAVVRAIFYYGLPVYWYTRGYIVKPKHI